MLNTGTINAALTNSLITSPLQGTLTAIDLSHGTGPQTLTQSANPAFAGVMAFNPTSTYAIGAQVSENGAVYEALSATGIGVDPATNSSIWRAIGAVNPTINGSVLFGSGGTTLTVNAGSIVANTIDLGSGVNTVNINGGSSTLVLGNLKDEGVNTLNAERERRPQHHQPGDGPRQQRQRRLHRHLVRPG